MVLALGGLLVLLALSQAPAAEAHTFTLAGKVRGGANSTVTMRLVKRRRAPRLVKHVVFRNVDSTIRLAPMAPAIANACVTETNRNWVAVRPRRRGRRSASAASERAGASASRTRIVHISTRRDAGIFTMDPRGNGRHRLRRGLVDGVAVSANGRRMVFARSRPTPCGRCPADFFVEVLVAKGNGRKQRMIKKFRHAGVESVAISPNGRWIAISLFRGAGADIYVMRSNGRSVKQLTKGRSFDASPSFSPNGKRIAFSREGRGTHIFSIRRRGGGLRRLTRGPGFNRDPVYSPNGRLIAFSRSRGDNSAIFTMRSDGSRRRRVTSHRRGVEDIDPDFSPGGAASSSPAASASASTSTRCAPPAATSAAPPTPESA